MFKPVFRDVVTVRIPADRNATVFFQPAQDAVPIGFEVLPSTSISVLDIKVGKNSQTANVAQFSSDMLSSMLLRLDRTHGALSICVTLHNHGVEEADVDVVFMTRPEAEAERRMVLPLGFSRLSRSATDAIAPRESTRLIARTQVGGVVRRIFVSKSVNDVDVKLGVIPWAGEPRALPVSSASLFPGFETEGRLDRGDALEMEVENRGSLPISTFDFVAVIESKLGGGD